MSREGKIKKAWSGEDFLVYVSTGLVPNKAKLRLWGARQRNTQNCTKKHNPKSKIIMSPKSFETLVLKVFFILIWIETNILETG